MIRCAEQTRLLATNMLPWQWENIKCTFGMLHGSHRALFIVATFIRNGKRLSFRKTTFTAPTVLITCLNPHLGDTGISILKVAVRFRAGQVKIWVSSESDSDNSCQGKLMFIKKSFERTNISYSIILIVCVIDLLCSETWEPDLDLIKIVETKEKNNLTRYWLFYLAQVVCNQKWDVF